MGSPQYVAYPNILELGARRTDIDLLESLGREVSQQGAQRFFQPSFDFAFDVMQPFSEQIGPFTQASMREIQRLLPERLAQQEQLFQKQGAFFTPDLQKAQQSIFSEVGQTQEDFLTRLIFGLTEQGVGLGQNLVGQSLNAANMGGSWLQNLLTQQFGVEGANVDLENAKRQMDRANQFDWGNLMQTSAPFASFIPGVGPLLSAGLSIGGGSVSQAQGLGGGGGFGGGGRRDRY